MPIALIAAWCVAGLLAALTAHVVYVGLRERRGRAAAVSGCLLGGLTLLWCAAVVLLPGLRAAAVIVFITAVAVLAILMFAPIGRRYALPAAPGERFDERMVMFARARYSPGDGRYETFYLEHPELNEPDDAIREMPRLGEPGSATWDPLNAPVQDALFGWLDRVRETASGPVAEGAVRMDPGDAAVRLKGMAMAMGAVSAGTTAVRPGHVYSRIGRGSGVWGAQLDPGRYPYALVFAVEMAHEMVGSAPMQPAVADSSRQYVEAAKIALAIATYLRALGHRARAHIDGNYRLVLPPLAADAGLGEVGRLSLLITPEYGPRVRLGAVTTSLTLPQDEPVKFGVEDFCRTCSKCARNCPSRALPLGDKEGVRGTSYWRIDPLACYRYWLRVGSDCGLCIAVCPYSHPRALMHSLVRAACRRSAVSRRIFSWADDLFYGRSPRSRRYPGWMLAGLDDEARERLGLR